MSPSRVLLKRNKEKRDCKRWGGRDIENLTPDALIKQYFSTKLPIMCYQRNSWWYVCYGKLSYTPTFDLSVTLWPAMTQISMFLEQGGLVELEVLNNMTPEKATGRLLSVWMASWRRVDLD